MTDQHPLTDEDLEDLEKSLISSVMGQRTLPSDFDLARAAADWQLEQVIEWMRDNLQDHRYSGIGIDVDYVIEALAQAMRPY